MGDSLHIRYVKEIGSIGDDLFVLFERGCFDTPIRLLNRYELVRLIKQMQEVLAICDSQPKEVSE
jgi:hypothetical protein